MATTITCSIGTRAADNVTVNSVSGSTPGPYTVTLNAAVPATTKVGDTFTDSGARKYLIEGISGSDLTVYKRHFGAGADPATGAGTTQRAYSTCQAWGAAAPADLTTADQVWRGETWNDGTITETASISLGATADATRYMILTTATGQSFRDHANKLTNALRPNQSNGVLVDITTHTSAGIQLDSAYCIVENIQVTDSRSSNNYYTVYGGTTLSNFGTFRHCLVKTNTTGASSGAAVDIRRMNIANCAFIMSANTVGVASSSGTAGKLSSSTLVNVSGSSSAKAISSALGGTPVVDSTATFNWGADNDAAAGSNNNATDRAAFGGSSSSDQVSLTTTDEIESATSGSEDLRAKFTSTLKGNGVRDQTYTSDLDIVGSARATGAAPSGPTIGAWEVVAGGGGGAVPILMQHYHGG